MDPLSTLNEEHRWKATILDEIFRALASSSGLSRMLVYQGARVLRLRLQEDLRASFDIDACLSSFAATAGDIVDASRLEGIKELVHQAISDYFEAQTPVRYELLQSTIANRRKIGPHPRGWDVYWLDLKVRDLADEATLSASAGQLRLDIAAPEVLSDKSISPLAFDGYTINAITLERIAGEKLRAFLSCLPTYRRKISEKTQIARRAKDLYDLVRITRKYPMSESAFWTAAASETETAGLSEERSGGSAVACCT